METEEKKYTQGEEFLNAFSHATGALFAIYAMVMLAFKSTTAMQSATTAIYSAMLFISFESSTCYHAMTNETAKKVFRRIDHIDAERDDSDLQRNAFHLVRILDMLSRNDERNREKSFPTH